MSQKPGIASPEELAEFLGGTDIKDVRQASSVEEEVERLKRQMEQELGDTWENLQKTHHLDIKVQTRIINTYPTGRSFSAAEANQIINNPGATARVPLSLPTDFKYSPLPEGYFRLMTIRSLGDMPVVDMEAFPMDTAPEYAAMSYAWGRDVSNRTFFCNNQNFSVGAHVLDALNHLGLTCVDKKLWIDAICINQADDSEKAVQVGEMQRIYSSAAQVIVWLGAAADDSSLVVDNIQAFLQWGLRVRQCGFLPGEEGGEQQQMLNPPPDILLKAFGRFLARPWFHRAWVVQELLLARNVALVCGNKWLDWTIFCIVVLLMKSNRTLRLAESPPHASKPLLEIAAANVYHLTLHKDTARAGLSVHDFIELLNSGRLRQITEPVDRIWAFLGLADPELRRAARPFIDYSPIGRAEYHKTYVNVAKLLLARDPELELLAKAPSYGRTASNLPTWCPDFTAPALSGCSIQDYVNKSFHAGVPPKGTLSRLFGSSASNSGKSPSKPLAVFPPTKINTLQLHGFHLDTVDQVVEVQYRTPSTWEDLRIRAAPRDQLAAWDSACLALAQAVFDAAPGTVPDEHWRTLSFGQLPDQPAPALRRAYRDFRNYAAQNRAEYPAGLTAEQRKVAEMFIDKANMAMSRAYFSTAGGRVGLGTRNVAKGDAVVIVHGAKVPYVIDPTTGSFKGDAYVDGAMYGEAFKDKWRGPDKVFELV